MSKTVTSVNLDEDIAERIASDPSMNMSGTVNMLLRQYLDGGKDATAIAMLELREEQLVSEIESLESETETKRQELERVRERLAEHRSESESVVEEALNKLDERTIRDMEPGTGTAEHWAGEAGMDEETFVDRLKTRWGDE